MGKEGKFQGKTTKDDIIEAVLKTKRHVSCQRVPKKLPVLYSYTLFTPTFQYFYTDISAISVTFRNSGGYFGGNWGFGHRSFLYLNALPIKQRVTLDNHQLALKLTQNQLLHHSWPKTKCIAKVEFHKHVKPINDHLPGCTNPQSYLHRLLLVYKHKYILSIITHR